MCSESRSRLSSKFDTVLEALVETFNPGGERRRFDRSEVALASRRTLLVVRVHPALPLRFRQICLCRLIGFCIGNSLRYSWTSMNPASSSASLEMSVRVKGPSPQKSDLRRSRWTPSDQGRGHADLAGRQEGVRVPPGRPREDRVLGGDCSIDPR